MRKQIADKSGNLCTVEVSTTQSGWKFPAGHPTRVADNGTEFYVMRIEYTLLEAADVPATTVDTLKALGIDDPIAEMNAGLKLAQGDLVKDQYRVKKGKASLSQMIVWMQKQTQEEIAKVQAMPTAEAAAYIGSRL